MKINRDFFDNPIVPEYILCKANKERIGVLQCTEKSIDIKFNDSDEINFSTYLHINNEKNLFYDAIDVMKYILLPDVGFYSITSVAIESESTEFEHKTIIAKSYESLLAQKYLEDFVINMGTTESLDGVQFYNLRNKSQSLLHLVLEKCPDWKIGHIDVSLQTMQRSFEVSRQDIYSFLNNDVAEAFGCFFLFDTIFFVELINTSASLRRLLLACVERMAFGTDFHMDALVGRACNECVPAVASHSCLMVLRMDSFSHLSHLAYDYFCTSD